MAARPLELEGVAAGGFDGRGQDAHGWSGSSGDTGPGQRDGADAAPSEAAAQGVGIGLWLKLMGRSGGSERGDPSISLVTYKLPVNQGGDRRTTVVGDFTGSCRHAVTRCDIAGTASTTTDCLENILCNQEGHGQIASVPRLTTTQPTPGSAKIQIGGTPGSEESRSASGLLLFGGPLQRVLAHTAVEEGQAVVSIRMGGSNI